MPTKTHSASRHHIHTLQDAIELMRSQGLTPGTTKETKTMFSVESVERVPGRRFNPQMIITVNAKQELEVQRA